MWSISRSAYLRGSPQYAHLFEWAVHIATRSISPTSRCMQSSLSRRTGRILRTSVMFFLFLFLQSEMKMPAYRRCLMAHARARV